jgi:hypothetical protein
MIRSFQFKPVKSEEQANWDILTQNTATKLFVPTLAGFDDGVTSNGYYVLYGPLVFVMLHIESQIAFGWGAESTIDIPVKPYIPTTDEFPQSLNPVVDVTTRLALNDEYPAVTASPDDGGRITLLTAQSASPTEVIISGFYLRN